MPSSIYSTTQSFVFRLVHLPPSFPPWPKRSNLSWVHRKRLWRKGCLCGSEGLAAGTTEACRSGQPRADSRGALSVPWLSFCEPHQSAGPAQIWTSVVWVPKLCYGSSRHSTQFTRQTGGFFQEMQRKERVERVPRKARQGVEPSSPTCRQTHLPAR